MSYKFEVESGNTVKFPVGGKYCDRDIVVTASEGISSPGLTEVSQEWEVDEFGYFEEFPDFMSVYNLPVLNYECTIYNYTFENNTENTRAGKYVNGIEGKAIDGKILKLESGVRVGGSAGGAYGVNVYPGCKIILTQKYV